jgi:hypothetical protein
MLRYLAIAAVTLFGVALWLILLELTDFSSLSVSAGLMGGLLVTGAVR